MHPRRFLIAVTVGAALVLLAAFFVVPARTWTAAGAPDAPAVEAADRDVLAKVKLAGLWEMPVGQWLGERATDDDVRDVGQRISTEHHALDRLTDATAAALDVPLPTHPTTEQQGWMADVRSRTGTDFDVRAVSLLRQAHGAVLPILVQIRVGTRNPVIRQFTTEAMAYVQRHIEYLESTGLVRYDQLPHPADLGMNDWRLHAATFAAFALLVAVLLTLLLLGWRTATGRRKTRPTPPRRTPEAPHDPHRQTFPHDLGRGAPRRDLPLGRERVGR